MNKKLALLLSVFLLSALPAAAQTEPPAFSFVQQMLLGFSGREVAVGIRLDSAGDASQPVTAQLRDEQGQVLGQLSLFEGKGQKVLLHIKPGWTGAKYLSVWRNGQKLSSDLLLVCDNLASKELRRVDNGHQQLAITFSASFNDYYVLEFLDLLNQYQAKATFFLSAEFAFRNPDTVREVLSRGHQLGSHSFSHLDLTKEDNLKIHSEIVRSLDMLEKVSGTRPQVFKPPFSYYNERIRAISRALGCEAVKWSLDSMDWNPEYPAWRIAARTLKKAQAGDIVQFHFGAKTLEAMQTILPAWQEAGYELVTLDTMLSPGPYQVDEEGRAHFPKP
ncbi:MAG: polysaccharide deacetylase family protein [Clostridiales bacterium]|nr:polysaccharide deacetylase family protein [Clostridiales bacterium]